MRNPESPTPFEEAEEASVPEPIVVSYTEEDEARARSAERWNKTSAVALFIAIALTLISSFTAAPEGLTIVLLVSSLVLGLFHLGTTMLMYSLKTERKRNAIARADEQAEKNQNS